MISVVHGPEAPQDADVLCNLPKQSGGGFELDSCTTQKTLCCWLFRCHWDHFHLQSPLSLGLGFVRVNKEASPRELSKILSSTLRNFG